ncbi:hypothetical protein AADZ90_003710 [Aestuariibius sp. 2305UL40-4]|uniref:hypothetical protein n=1 Tax=Aestuariibius violaceus TaxID=3234132 RepID=UPI00345E71F8
MPRIDVKVFADIKGGADLEDVTARAAAEGLKVEQVISRIGAIFGSCDEARIERLRALDGVSRVAPEGQVQLPPRSPDIPQ